MTRPSVLVVDDNPIALRLARATLEAEGWTVSTAGTAAEAERAFARSRPDVAVLDMSLPDIDGCTLARRLRARDPEVPLVACSALLSALGDWYERDSLFDLLLPKPLARDVLVQSLARLVRAPPPATTGLDRRVLVVDDDPRNRRLLAAHFGAAGFQVELAGHGAEALALLERGGTPDIVVSDVLMPEVDGFSLCMAIRASVAHADLPVLLVSSNYDEAADAELAAKAGATSFLVRGASLDQLTEGVLACLSAPRATTPIEPDADEVHVRRAQRQLDRQIERNTTLASENELLAARLATLAAVAQAGAGADEAEPVGELLQTMCDAAGLAGAALWLAAPDGSLRLAGAHLLEPTDVGATALMDAWHEGRGAGGAVASAPVVSRGERVGVLAVRVDEGAVAGDPLGLARAVAVQLGHSVCLTRAFTRLAQAETRWAALMDNANDAIAVLDREGRYVEVNRRWEDLIGASKAELVGRRVVDFVPEAVRVALGDEIQRGFAAGRLTRNGDTWYRRDGTPGVVDFTMSVVNVAGESLAVTIARDVTDRARLESELRHAQKTEAIGRLAASVAHDFSSLLTVVLTDAHLLAQGGIEGEQVAEIAREIGEAAEQGRALTRHLLAFGRRDPGRPRVMDVNALLMSSASVLRRLAGPQVTLVVKSETSPAWAVADDAELEQVLLNLVTNARDAMPQGGTITMTARTQGSRVVVSVADTGDGIDAATLPHIFEPFYTTKGPSGGTGLGLATVKAIAERLGGEARVESLPGQGATFHVWIPRVAYADGEPRLVLLVEPLDELRTDLSRALAEAGYRVALASDLPSALETVATGRTLDAVVANVVIGDTSGPEVVRALRKRLPTLPAVFVSAETVVGDVAFLRIPVAPDALRSKVEEAITHAAV